MINWFLQPIDNNKILFDYLLDSFEKIIYSNKKLEHIILNKKKMFTLYCNWVYFNSHTKIEN